MESHSHGKVAVRLRSPCGVEKHRSHTWFLERMPFYVVVVQADHNVPSFPKFVVPMPPWPFESFPRFEPMKCRLNSPPLLSDGLVVLLLLGGELTVRRLVEGRHDVLWFAAKTSICQKLFPNRKVLKNTLKT